MEHRRGDFGSTVKSGTYNTHFILPKLWHSLNQLFLGCL